VGRNLTRWLIPLPAILFTVFPQTVNAEPVLGLNAVGYTITEIPPTRSDTIYQTCGSETENNINRNFNGEPFQQCPVDLFMVHYTGFITVPENNTIQFMIAADDGGVIGIGNTSFGTWNDKHCSWSAITTAAFPAATYALDGWFYEHGGSTCFMLAWNINGAGWAIVPDSAFTRTVRLLQPPQQQPRPRQPQAHCQRQQQQLQRHHHLRPPPQLQRQPQQLCPKQQPAHLHQPLFKKVPQRLHKFSQAQPAKRQQQAQTLPPQRQQPQHHIRHLRHRLPNLHPNPRQQQPHQKPPRLSVCLKPKHNPSTLQP